MSNVLPYETPQENLRAMAKALDSYATDSLEVNHTVIAEGLRELANNLDFAKTTHPMVAAYHALYDFKDAQVPGSDQFVRAYESLSYMAQAMQDMDIVVPTRYDKAR